MININKEFKIEGGVPPYTYVVDMIGSYTSNSPTQNIAEIDLSFTTNNTQAQVVGFDSQGCSFIYDLNLEGVCDTLRLSPITQSENTYQAIAISSCDINYIWNYNEQYYDAEINSNSITLRQLSNAPNTTLKLTVTDCNGCTLSTERTIIPCNVQANNVTVFLTENEETGRWLGSTILPISTECGLIDYNTFNPSITSLITSTIQGSTISFSVPNYLRGAPITYDVTNTLGVTSNRATIQFQYEESDVNQPNVPTPTQVDIGIGTYVITEGVDYIGRVDSVRLVSFPFNTLGTTVISTPTGYEFTYNYQGDAQIQNYQLIRDAEIIQTSYFSLIPRPIATIIPNQLVSGPCNTLSNFTLPNNLTPDIVDLYITDGEETIQYGDFAMNILFDESRVLKGIAYNEQGVSTKFDINFCTNCAEIVTVQSCELTHTLYNYLNNAKPNGTFTLSSNPVPTTWDAEVTFPGPGLYTYFYSYTPDKLENDYQCQNLTAQINIQILSSTTTSNNTLSTSKVVLTDLSPNTITLNEEISNDCFNTSTPTAQNFSTSINYDVWYDIQVPVDLIPNTNYSLTINVNSSMYNTYLSGPLMSLYVNGVPTIINNYRSLYNNSIIYTFNSDNYPTVNLQVASINPGKFDLSVKLEEDLIG